MALIALIASAACAFCAVLFACPGHSGSHKTVSRVLRRTSRLLSGLVSALSRTSAAEAVSRSKSASVAADSLRSWFQGRGIHLTNAESAAVLILLSGASALLGALLAASPLGAAVGFAAFMLGTGAFASKRRRAHEQALSSEMPAVFRSLAVSLGSGLTLSQAIAYVGSREDSVAAPAFAHCSLRLMCGDPYEEVLLDLSRELNTSGAGLLASALAISHRTGSPLHGLFMRSAGLVERAGELERLLVVKTAQVRLSVRVVCLLPALLVAILLMISPDYQAGISTPAGMVSLALAVCMDLAAVLIVRSLSKVVL